MHIVSQSIIGLIALTHIYLLWVEMFAWTSSGKKIFKNIPEDLFEKTKVMAANQGLYNGFLASGLLWSLYINDINWGRNIAVFFLVCIIVAGLYGASSTASKRVFYVQVVPAILALFSLAF